MNLSVLESRLAFLSAFASQFGLVSEGFPGLLADARTAPRFPQSLSKNRDINVDRGWLFGACGGRKDGVTSLEN
jgi:hypothetical protein